MASWRWAKIPYLCWNTPNYHRPEKEVNTRTERSTPVRAETGVTHQNPDEGLQSLKGQCIPILRQNGRKIAGNLWNASFRGVVSKTPLSHSVLYMRNGITLCDYTVITLLRVPYAPTFQPIMESAMAGINFGLDV